MLGLVVHGALPDKDKGNRMVAKLSFMQDKEKVLGSGDWFVDNDNSGSFCYSGIWQAGKVVALVLDEHSDSNVVKERGNLIVKAVNSHQVLIDAMRKIADADPSESGCYYTNRENIRVARAALSAIADMEA